MKIRMVATVEVSPDSWCRWAGIDEDRVRADVIEYFTDACAWLPGIADTDAVVRWKIKDPPRGAPRPAASWDGTPRWPTAREHD